jgi:hypothetical protein
MLGCHPGPPLGPGAGQGLRPARPGRAALPQLPRPLEHLATLTRKQVPFAGTRATVPVLAEPTSAQREAFDLIGVPIPLTVR